jgi:hypothetical protein
MSGVPLVLSFLPNLSFRLSDPVADASAKLLGYPPMVEGFGPGRRGWGRTSTESKGREFESELRVVW